MEYLYLFLLVNGKMRECVSRMWIDEDGMIDVVSDHNMLVVECNLYGRNERKVKQERKKWRLRDVRWEDFQIDLRELDWMSILFGRRLQQHLFGIYYWHDPSLQKIPVPSI